MKKKFGLRMILIIIGIIFLIWFLLAPVRTLNLNVGSATGIGLSILLILYGIFMKPVNELIRNGWHSLGGKIIEILLLVICAVIIGLAAACSVAMISAASRTAEAGSTVIVLGARVYQNRVSVSVANRLNAAYVFLQDNPESVCIVSGGQGKNEPCTEASVMYDYLVQKGIDPERIFIEDKSTDTQENIAYSKILIEENELNPVVALATDGYHEYRALGYAQRAGLEAGAVPAGTVWWLFPTSILREMYGILEQWILK